MGEKVMSYYYNASTRKFQEDSMEVNMNEFYEAFFFALKGHLKYETMNKLKTEIKPSKYTSNKNDIITLNTKVTNIFDSILCTK